ncbi:MAG: CPBP family intramembrane metalloprotease [Lewinella sp.]|nr:CPBP family intramembrane metalloprotease [Lewinella sp.]
MPEPSISPLAQRSPAILVLLLLCAMVGGALGGLLGDLVAGSMGVQMTDITQGAAPRLLDLTQRNAVRWFNLLAHLGAFTLGSLATAWLAYRGGWLRNTYLNTWPRLQALPYILWLLLGGFFLMQLIYWLNRQLPLPDWMWDMENQQNWLVEQVIRMESPLEFLLTLLVAAVAPAFGEELLFRGLIQPQLRRWAGSVHLAVWVTAALFSAIHLQFAGFIPRLLLGAMLGYLLVWTGSLWAPILAHFLFNGVQIVTVYAFGQEFDTETPPEVNATSIGLALLGLVLFWWSARQLQTLAPPPSEPEPSPTGPPDPG